MTSPPSGDNYLAAIQKVSIMQAESSWKKQLPMIATYARIVLAPILVVAFSMPTSYAGWLAAILFTIGSITDWLDGYWARLYGAESAMGKLMDPIADKILVLSALIMLLSLGRVGPVMVIILLARDVYIGGIRSAAALDQVIIAAKPLGKWKTATQMVSIPCLFIYEPLFGVPLATIGFFGMWISVALSLISGIEYTYGYYRGQRT